MKAILLESPHDIKVSSIPKPKIEHDQALVRVRAVGICGSDIEAYRGNNPLVTYPRIIGHEVAGDIVEIDGGDGKLAVGDRVILNPYIYCGQCYPCSLGRTNCCENLNVIGVHSNGGMSEYIAYPTNMLIPVNKCIDWEHVPLAEPLTIALNAIYRVRLKKGEKLAINGAGAIGILIALCAIYFEAVPILADVVEERLLFAQKLGIEHTINPNKEDFFDSIRELTDGRMAEAVVEASGANTAVRNTLDMVSYAGRIAFTGWPKKDTLMPTNKITLKELDLLGSRTSVGKFEQALDLMATGKVEAKAVLSKVISFDQIPGMIEELSEHPGRYLKVNAML